MTSLVVVLVVIAGVVVGVKSVPDLKRYLYIRGM
jgi:hypothetical protein